MSMKKKKGGGFTNLAAKKFSDENKNKIDQYAESEIYEILETDLDEILNQLSKNREFKGKFPKYIGNMGLNISVSKYIYKYMKKNWKALSKDEKESMLQLISQLFTESASGKYNNQNQDLEKADRQSYLLKAFEIGNKKRVKIAMKLGLKREQSIELALQTYLEPRYGIRHACIILDRSTESLNRKMKIFKKLYKNNLNQAMGASLCVDNKSEIVSHIFTLIMKMNKKKRYKCLRHYAETFKKIKRYNFFLKSDEFTGKDSNKRIIKDLIKEDRGYKKAFDMASYAPSKKKSKKEKKSETKKDKKEKSRLDLTFNKL